ncbi:MAG: FixH family protein [Candidatus Sulfobium sp.]|jgi:hypothetical protein
MKVSISCGMAAVVMIVALAAGNFPCDAHQQGGFANGAKAVFTKHFQKTLFDITDHAAYSVEILPNDEEYNIGKNVIGIVVHNARDEDVKGAELSFVLTDLTSGKSSKLTPTIKDRGNGLYIVSGLHLKKKGKWKLEVTVKKGRVEDSVKFVLPDAFKNPLPKGRYSQ